MPTLKILFALGIVMAVLFVGYELIKYGKEQERLKGIKANEETKQGAQTYRTSWAECDRIDGVYDFAKGECTKSR